MRYLYLVLLLLPILTGEVKLSASEIDCNFENDVCKWYKEAGWFINTDIPKIENNEFYIYKRDKGSSQLTAYVQSDESKYHFYIEYWKAAGTRASLQVKTGNEDPRECKFDKEREWIVYQVYKDLKTNEKVVIKVELENDGFVAIRKSREFDSCRNTECQEQLYNIIWNSPKLPPDNSESESYIIYNSEKSVSIKSPEIPKNIDTTVTLKYWLNSETPDYTPTLSIYVEKNKNLVKLLPLTKYEDGSQELVFKAGYTVRVDSPYKIVFTGEGRGLDKAGIAIQEIHGKHSPIEDTVIQVFWSKDVKIIYEMFEFYGWEISGLFEKQDISVELKQGFKEGVIRSRWMKWKEGMHVKVQYQCTQPAKLEIEMIDMNGNAVVSNSVKTVPGNDWIDVTVALEKQVEEFMIGIRGSLIDKDPKLRVQNIKVMHPECKDDSLYEPFEDSFICKCIESGFYYDYKEEKCLEMLGECKDDSTYEPFEDSFICKCKESGFYYDYKEEKCLEMLGECKDDSIYEPLNDSFICKCKESGFYYDYKEEKCLVTDITNSSCLLQNCPETKVCDLETQECKCKHNYIKQVDGDECEATTCAEGGVGYKDCKAKGENFECQLSGDKYECRCKHGFKELNDTCEDICKDRSPSCDTLTQVCRIKNSGESTCECKPTLVPDGNGKCQVDIGSEKGFISVTLVIKNIYNLNGLLDLKILTKHVDDAFKKFLGKKCISAEVTSFKRKNSDNLECFIVVEILKNVGDEFTSRIESTSIYVPTADPNYVILPPHLVVLKSWLKKENFRTQTRCLEANDIKYCPMGTDCSEDNVSYWCTCSEGSTRLISLFDEKDKEEKYPTEICIDKNECLQLDICPENSECRNLIGTYECNCKSGFRKHDSDPKCVGICNPSPCVNGRCEVIEDNFYCRCNTGYKGRKCEETDTEYDSWKANVAIVGGVLGGLLALVIIVFVIIFYNLRKKQSQTRTVMDSEDKK